MPKRIAKLLAAMRRSPKGVSFSDALAVARYYFGEPRRSGSHHVFSMPWPGDPRVNLQDDGHSAKAYQARQLLTAVARCEAQKGNNDA